MSEDELRVVRKLGEAWNAFLKLPAQHNDDVPEFRHAIHAAQHIVMARPALREMLSDAR